MSVLPATTSQTVGPFFSHCLLRDDMSVLARPDTAGEQIRIEGQITDGDGAPISDAVMEIWQANAYGRYNHPLDTRELPLQPEFTGFGRCGTDAAGHYAFQTVKPGRVPFDDTTLQAPHICVTLYARGLLNHLSTRLYFDGDADLARDAVLRCVPAARRHTLIAPRQPGEGQSVYRFDVRLQGPDETVFFEL